MTFGLMYGLYSRAASNQERPMMARVRYLEQSSLNQEVIREAEVEALKTISTIAKPEEEKMSLDIRFL